jgi:hypothetical protein
MPNYEFIEKIETYNSGGNVMLDAITLKDGRYLVISDEVMCLYDSEDAFNNGEYDDSKCIELYDYREMENV